MRRYTTNTSTNYDESITVQKLQSFIGKGNVLCHPLDDITKYTTDWTKLYTGGGIVVKPSSDAEVSDILKYCENNNLKVVPQGGNTGLVGGQVGILNEIILSLERLSKVISVNPIASYAIVEAGCILQDVNNHLEKQGFMLPIDLGSKGSCQIGGNVATNAGGLRLLRYGSLHENVLGLEVIKANGEKLDMLKTLHKDNAGYHLKNLFIGSEGTLGIITKIAIQIKPLPTSIQVSLIKLKTFLDISVFVTSLRKSMNEILSAVEFIDSQSLYAVHLDSPHILKRISKASTSFTLPFPINTTEESSSVTTEAGGAFVDMKEIWVLIETSGNDFVNDKLRLEDFLSDMIAKEIAVDAIVSQDQTQLQNLWALREYVPVALAHVSRKLEVINNDNTIKYQTKNSKYDSAAAAISCTGRLFKYDVSIAVDEMPSLLQDIKSILQSFNFPLKYDSATAAYSATDPQHNGETADTRCNLSNIITFTKEEENIVKDLYNYADIKICCFGHIGDQNLHLNVLLTWSFSFGDSSEKRTQIVEFELKHVELYKTLLKVITECIFNCLNHNIKNNYVCSVVSLHFASHSLYWTRRSTRM